MQGKFRKYREGYTIVELMVTVLIVAILSTTLGVFFIKLLSIQEQDREEAYIREKLTDICGKFADYMSVGSSIEYISAGRYETIYRQETGGVSFETGRVTRVAKLISSFNTLGNQNRTLDLIAYACEMGCYTNRFARNLRGGDTPLIPINGLKEMKIVNNKIDLSYGMTPLNAAMSSASLWKLQVMAQYEVENKKGTRKSKTLTSERIVRLWNFTEETEE